MEGMYANFIAALVAKAEIENSGGGSGTVIENQIVFSLKSDFPETGEENMLYVATDECMAYIWDGQEYNALSTGESSVDIDVIQSIL